jgi:hypothetical protein
MLSQAIGEKSQTAVYVRKAHNPKSKLCDETDRELTDFTAVARNGSEVVASHPGWVVGRESRQSSGPSRFGLGPCGTDNFGPTKVKLR